MNIQLPTGKTMSISVYEYFELDDSEINLFYQAAIADDLGTFLENPWSGKRQSSKLEIDSEQDVNVEENIPNESEEFDD